MGGPPEAWGGGVAILFALEYANLVSVHQTIRCSGEGDFNVHKVAAFPRKCPCTDP